MSTLTPRPGILDISPYVGGESKLAGIKDPIKLSANETPLGASPMAREAFVETAGELHIYPDGHSTELRDAIAEHYGLAADRIVCGAGSDELLHLLVLAYAGAGDEVIHTAHGFLVYQIAAQAHGATPVSVAERDLTANVDNILGAVSERTKIVFLANPNNPTGTYLPMEELKRLREGLPDHVLLVVDAAYAEYVRSNDYEAGIELVSSHRNVVMTRTFSKIYGLAALRLGWAYCPADVADVLNRIRGPFNVSIPAQRAGIAALRDTAFTEKAIAHNEKWLAWLKKEIGALGIKVHPSAANFLLLEFPETPGASAKDADAFLKTRGLILRRLESYGLPKCLRLSVGLEDANREVVSALADFVKGQA